MPWAASRDLVAGCKGSGFDEGEQVRSDWTWEYIPDAANVVGGLTRAQIDQVESLASRIAHAVAVRRIGTHST
jgi:hypothetical protein